MIHKGIICHICTIPMIDHSLKESDKCYEAFKHIKQIIMDPKDEIKKVEENDSLEKNEQENINQEKVDDQDDLLARKLAKQDFDNFGKRMKNMEEDNNE